MRLRRSITFFAIVATAICGMLFAWARAGKAQQGQGAKKNQPTLTIEEYQPKSTLVTKEHKIERAKFPFIDIHSHHWNPTPEEVDRLVKEMDTINLRVMVDLSGGTGVKLKNTVAMMKRRYPLRIVVFSDMTFIDF